MEKVCAAHNASALASPPRRSPQRLRSVAGLAGGGHQLGAGSHHAKAFALGAATLLLGVARAHAQDAAQLRPLCADRPGKATPPCILDADHLQLEVGLVDFSELKAAGDRDRTLAIGGFELRAGLTRRTEMEVAWTPLILDRDRQAGTTQRRSGVGDLTFGFRTALTDPDTQGVLVSVEPFVTAPTATQGLGAGGWTGGVLLPVQAPLPGQLSLTVTPQIAAARDADGRGAHLAAAAAAGLSRPVGPLTLGAELWGLVDDDPQGRTYQASFDVSCAWTPKAAPDLQFDGGVNAGLTRHTPDVEAYVGVSRRF